MAAAEPALQRSRMSWEEYLELPEKPKAEWVDGEVVVTPPVSVDHGFAVGGLHIVLRGALAHLYVVSEVGIRLPRNRLRAPDVMVVERWPEEKWVTEPPVLVVEVLSRSTRSEDTVRKWAEYFEGGVGQYWILDPEHRALDVHLNTDEGWQLVLHLDDATPTGEIAVADHGTVHLDLGDLLH